MSTIYRKYVSFIDQQLANFRKNNPKTKSQLNEIKKYEKINLLRDNNEQQPQPHKEENFWDTF